MPDDVGGRPYPNGREPDDDRGGADEDFASVVFDEDFVRAAAFHEPTAVERLLAAAEARAEADARRAGGRGGPFDDERYDEDYGQGGYDPLGPDDDGFPEHGPYGRHGGSLRPYRGAARWHRPVAWLLAVLMGVGMVALAFSAVYRNSSGDRQDQVPPPATSGVDSAPGPGPGSAPSDADEYSRPMVSAVPRTP
ncbi:hypothetical protein K388_01792 [Streptomyces sp. KhCrAH-43]|uniref:SCO2584 family spore wall biosynthesis protein n=1 Tax=unclassified Streptomyces TaxID=2593676 RepID=UPI00037AD2DD|nr:hypothetical protein [Streptomyces sp. KhCrAH-43]MYS34802.1 hypothetical protein [Streptomyces sp. SID4920]MYX65421.1 hypothetical protein [Streptomyces sp. SID8373]RAJ64602.1 hypothetical protein K388_01792 [Streptomyces sp. KhCrAH-43]